MGKLEGKIPLVTGGNSGIGLATAKQFVNEGAYVFITRRREPELNAAVKEIGENVAGVQGDVPNLGYLDRLSNGTRAAVIAVTPLCFPLERGAICSPLRSTEKSSERFVVARRQVV